MKVSICSTNAELGKKAARDGACLIRSAIRSKGSANIILATGASQFEMLKALASEERIFWNRVTVFHLDEYVGMPVTHPASFRLYLWHRFLRKLPLPVRAFHQIDAEKNPGAECERFSRLIRTCPSKRTPRIDFRFPFATAGLKCGVWDLFVSRHPYFPKRESNYQ